RPAGRQARHRHAEPAALRRGPRRARRVADDPEVALRTPTEATMRFTSQKVAYPFFATCLLLLSLQIVYGFVMAFAHMGYDVLHDWIPFNAARAPHTNLLVVWLLTGFMGSAYYIIPEESGRELWSP